MTAIGRKRTCHKIIKFGSIDQDCMYINTVQVQVTETLTRCFWVWLSCFYLQGAEFKFWYFAIRI